MQAGDAKILRNAGARVTDDVLRTLVLASYLLGVQRELVMPHTDCRMATADEAAIRGEVAMSTDLLEGPEPTRLASPVGELRVDLSDGTSDFTPIG